MRTQEQIREHYLIERELADRLRRAEKAERRKLYGPLYDELFRRVPHHPQLLRKADGALRAEAAANQLRLLSPFLGPGMDFLEIGAGDLSLSLEASRRVGRVFATDVSSRMTRDAKASPNFRLLAADALGIPLPDKSVDLAYSSHLLEHLHPDDAPDHLREVARVLRAGGRYLCVTPHAVYGPHDVSRHFDKCPTGFHLREYTVREIGSLFRKSGFGRLRLIYNTRKRFLLVPAQAGILLESAIRLLPAGLGGPILSGPRVQCLLGIKIIACKSG